MDSCQEGSALLAKTQYSRWATASVCIFQIRDLCACRAPVQCRSVLLQSFHEAFASRIDSPRVLALPLLRTNVRRIGRLSPVLKHLHCDSVNYVVANRSAYLRAGIRQWCW